MIYRNLSDLYSAVIDEIDKTGKPVRPYYNWYSYEVGFEFDRIIHTVRAELCVNQVGFNILDDLDRFKIATTLNHGVRDMNFIVPHFKICLECQALFNAHLVMSS